MFFDDVDGGAAAKPVSTGLYHLLRIFKSPYTAGSLYQGVISDGFFHECHMARRRASCTEAGRCLDKIRTCLHGQLTALYDLLVGEQTCFEYDFQQTVVLVTDGGQRRELIFYLHVSAFFQTAAI